MLYHLILQLYKLGIRIASIWQPKAKAWISGRKNWRANLKSTFKEAPKSVIWFHCASLGEFEQGRPLMEQIKQEQPEQKIVLTFFSPSGYEVRKNYQGADYIWYLPLDTQQNAVDLVNLIQPRMAIFVKYEFWYHFLQTLQLQDITTYLIGGLFRQDQYFFKWYGKRYLSLLKGFSHIFVQNDSSKRLLEKHGVSAVAIAGDPRIDRVVHIAQTVRRFPMVESFKNKQPLLVLGSTHPKDITIWSNFITKNKDWKILIVPHEVEDSAIQQLENSLPVLTHRYTALDKNTSHLPHPILIMDTIGMLNQLYQYAGVVYIGGGFDEGIHNTLEPAVFGVPILIGPKYEKFEEAKRMLQTKGMRRIQKEADVQPIMNELQTATLRKELGAKNKEFILTNRGGTKKIYDFLFG